MQIVGIAATTAAPPARRRSQPRRQPVCILLHRVERALDVSRDVVPVPNRGRNLVELTRERDIRRRRIGDARLKRVHLHRHVVLTLAFGGCQHDVGIVVDPQRPGVDGLAIDDQLHLVAAAEHGRTRGRRRSESEPAAARRRRCRASRAERARLGRLRLRLRQPTAFDLGSPLAFTLCRTGIATGGRCWQRRRRLHAKIPARCLNAGSGAVLQHVPGDLAHFASRSIDEAKLDVVDRLLVQP